MATKNRDGKPTVFQKQKLRDLGFAKRVKTYREAENAIKRLRNANKSKPCHKPCIHLRPSAAEELRDSIGSKPKAETKPAAKTRSGFLVVSAFIPVTLPAKKAK